MKRLIFLLLLPLAWGFLRLTQEAKSDDVKSNILNAASPAEAYNLYLAAYNDVEDAGLRASPAAAARRKRAFINNLSYIKLHNRAGASEYEMGVNSFTMMEEQERQEFLGLDTLNRTAMVGPGTTSVSVGLGAVLNAPTSKSWKSMGYIGPVKNQGGCGSCWSFAATVPLEFIYAAATGRVKSLAEQLYLDCTYETREPGKDGCQGGLSQYVYQWVQDKNYAWDWNSVRYEGRDRRCSYTSHSNVFDGVVKIKEVKEQTERNSVSQMEANMIAGLQEGPMVNYYRVENDFWSYNSGYYDGCRTDTGATGWHAVSTVGYTASGWEVKNSWGRDWGHSGFFYVKRGRNICHFSEWSIWLIGEKLGDGGDGGGGDCQDTAEYANDCPTWKSYGYCDGGQYKQFMDDHCSKTCGSCGADGGGSCSDTAEYASNCPTWKSYGYCDGGQYKPFMMDHCSKTCGQTCGGGGGGGGSCKDSAEHASNCGTWKSYGYCDGGIYRPFMLDHCAKTCGKCATRLAALVPTDT